MTTPAAPVTVSTDKASYDVGDPIVVTVEYADPANPGTTVTVTATVTGTTGVPVTGTAQVQVGGAPAQPLPVAVTDSFGSVYAQQSNAPGGTAVFTGTIAAVPPGA
ncbi:MAG: hypothetical protein JWM19_989 [Actinomycetia bacterium]|nr:hypothetical protein [Actinomycetes bacterium]